MSIWYLLKFRIKWIVEHYFRYTILPTWKYNYNLSKEWESGSEFKKDLLGQIRALHTYIERIEGENKALNTIANNQRERMRQYARFFMVTGISEKILGEDFDRRHFTDSIYETLILKITNEEDGKGTGNEKEERKDTGETPGN